MTESSAAMDSYIFKIKFGEILRRVTMKTSLLDNEPSLNFSQLQQTIRDAFKIPASSEVVVTYSDKDSDEVTMVGDHDLHDACVLQGLNPLRLTVVVAEELQRFGPHGRDSRWGQGHGPVQAPMPPPPPHFMQPGQPMPPPALHVRQPGHPMPSPPSKFGQFQHSLPPPPPHFRKSVHRMLRPTPEHDHLEHPVPPPPPPYSGHGLSMPPPPPKRGLLERPMPPPPHLGSLCPAFGSRPSFAPIPECGKQGHWGHGRRQGCPLGPLEVKNLLDLINMLSSECKLSQERETDSSEACEAPLKRQPKTVSFDVVESLMKACFAIRDPASLEGDLGFSMSPHFGRSEYPMPPPPHLAQPEFCMPPPHLAKPGNPMPPPPHFAKPEHSMLPAPHISHLAHSMPPPPHFGHLEHSMPPRPCFGPFEHSMSLRPHFNGLECPVPPPPHFGQPEHPLPPRPYFDGLNHSMAPPPPFGKQFVPLPSLPEFPPFPHFPPFSPDSEEVAPAPAFVRGGDKDQFNSSQQTKDETVQYAIVGCDGCGMLPILGTRYKANDEDDYDLCENCFEKLDFTEDFTKIDSPVITPPPFHPYFASGCMIYCPEVPHNKMKPFFNIGNPHRFPGPFKV